ncbi:putative choline transporter, neither null mutation nor overexpression affects choline transport [Exophiala dermatitidis]|uniref:Protein PNS1 n=2 Tax=Exophiala dermatitidis TaxID=5970 RepID=H6C9L4_EXODN|nr:CDW92 antigen [Exophiala dermatitidis NIH/UT8656]KAJ4524862.1 putative choline transporter, neither null mutation nor overexpression affects choline transport [Exophiala dermatitidis]EHY60730.1 CDW92 antigen [Exophiala dermatitidis NIH/UT8656]KAJ4527744.1 putative choline transporter, neither null mutation nor overexpression affects choline transport [Exophiala dermatitidis]KAJ4528380.1 putative choline transporter, neither null mutation nor overexpression affects choline transport [Exophial
MAHQGQAADYYNSQPYQQQGYQQPGYQQQSYQPYPPPPTHIQQGYQQQEQYQPPQQPYQPPEPKYTQQPPTYGAQFVPPQDDKQSFQDTFKIQKPKFNDLWAGLLLIATFCGFVAVSGLTLYRYSKYHKYNGDGISDGANNFSLNTNTIILFAFVLCVGFAFSWAYFLAARAFTKQFVWLTGILNCALAIATAVYYLYRRLWGAGIVFAIFAVFAVICFISWIPRIPFAVVMLQQTMDIARMRRVHVFWVSLIGGIISLAFAAWFSVTLVAIYTSYMPSNANSNPNPACADGGCSSGKVIGLVVFVTFAGYWISEWIKNTIYTTIAGVYGSWYFCAGKPGGIPSGATAGALRRATTYSFGSISFGSLIVALINMLRQACSIAQQQEASEGNLIGSIMFCILGCIVACLDWLVEFINRYAFSHIALYGKPYIPAAKDTWHMMKDRGIDALVNDCLVGPVLTMGSVFVAYLSALLAYLYLDYTNPAYNSDRTFTPVIMAFAFLIGLQICQTFMTPIGAGVDTVFVAMAWDPQVAITDHPEFWDRLVHVYPHVQQVIHV